MTNGERVLRGSVSSILVHTAYHLSSSRPPYESKMRISSRLRGIRFSLFFLSTVCLLIAYLPTALGLQQELAGIVDWHKPLIGEPLLEPTPPLFVEGKEIDGGRVVQLTKKNLLAVLNAENGEIGV